MNKEKWIHMPHPGHFIAASRCNFRLNTCVGKFIVSTVGEFQFRDSIGEDFDDIGVARKYETYVFKAKKSKHKCCPMEMCDPSEVDSLPANNPEDATNNHWKLCKKWSKKNKL